MVTLENWYHSGNEIWYAVGSFSSGPIIHEEWATQLSHDEQVMYRVIDDLMFNGYKTALPNAQGGFAGWGWDSHVFRHRLTPHAPAAWHAMMRALRRDGETCMLYDPTWDRLPVLHRVPGLPGHPLNSRLLRLQGCIRLLRHFGVAAHGTPAWLCDECVCIYCATPVTYWQFSMCQICSTGDVRHAWRDVSHSPS